MTELTRAIDTLKDYCKRYRQNYFAHDIQIILTEIEQLQEKLKSRDHEIIGMLDSVSECLGIQKAEDLCCPYLRALALLVKWRKND